MDPQTVNIEAEYNRRIDEMTPTERLQRSFAMLDFARRAVARQVLDEKGKMSEARLKWEVALRTYGPYEPVRSWIQAELDRVQV